MDKPNGTYQNSMSEMQLQDTIVQAATLQGYLWYHTHDSRRSPPGFPDLVIAGHGRLIFWECKSKIGTASTDQQKWLDALGTVAVPPLVELVRPADLNRCLGLLAR